MYGLSGALGATPSPFQTLVKIDMEAAKENRVTSWYSGEDDFFSEPVFIQNQSAKSEDDGRLLMLNSNTKDLTSQLFIFDAKDISKGPTQRIDLPIYVPYGLHGNYVDKLTFDFEDVKRKFTAFSALDSKNWNEMEGGFSGLGIKYEFD